MKTAHEVQGWTTSLDGLRRACMSCAAGEELQRLHEALDLLRRTPRELGPSLSRAEAGKIEIMLACGAAESAALHLIGPQTSVMMSRGSHGQCLASAVTEPDGLELMCEGATVSLAVLAAHLSMVMEALGLPEVQMGERLVSGWDDPVTLH
ncbi:hypothetical protein [Novosphingobium sp. 9]|uniref:hypothetical protein n=1 Tax=Novosphingobium sp. 9 TaxID=2025349 RepID=UPI0021B657A1|nr:hypothetical protein [Novosphingobium sp. 9]